MKQIFALFLSSFILSLGALQAQEDTTGFWNRIFLPSLDVGYQIAHSDLIDNSVKFGTSIEYRFTNNNDFFVRLCYDTYGAKYALRQANTTNTIEGTAQFTDVFFGPGYRFGDRTFRVMVAFTPGIKLYEFPTAEFEDERVLITQNARSVLSANLLTTIEYYFDEKSALTLSLFQNYVFEDVDFWARGRNATGFSIGFITSLM